MNYDMNYHSDPRVRALRSQDQKVPHHVHNIDRSRMIGVVTLWDDEDEEQDFEVPLEFAVCPTCEGRGSHTNPSIDCNGLTREDFDQDPGFEEEYFSGRYDVTCYGCNGRNVIAVISDRVDPKVAERIREAEESDRQDQAMYESERRMGC